MSNPLLSGRYYLDRWGFELFSAVTLRCEARVPGISNSFHFPRKQGEERQSGRAPAMTKQPSAPPRVVAFPEMA